MNGYILGVLPTSYSLDHILNTVTEQRILSNNEKSLMSIACPVTLNWNVNRVHRLQRHHDNLPHTMTLVPLPSTPSVFPKRSRAIRSSNPSFVQSIIPTFNRDLASASAKWEGVCVSLVMAQNQIVIN